MKKNISKYSEQAIKETLYLKKNGVVDVVLKREKDNSGYTNVDDIDWQNL